MIDFNAVTANEKQKNILAILNNIFLKQELSATEIANSTHLSIATVSRALKFLKEEQIIITTGKEITDMGRHPDIISLNPDYGYYLHFYLRTEHIKGYLIDFFGNVIVSQKITINRAIKVNEFVSLLHSFAQLMMGSKNLPYEKIIAASLAVPGLVDDQNKVVKRIPNFMDFRNANLFDCLQKELGVPVIINNRARLCAVGEHIHTYPNYANIVYIDFTNYSGIGAGIILGGELYTGSEGFAGEIGDMLTDIHDFDKIFYEDQGALETQAGVGILFDRVMSCMKVERAQILKKLMLQNETGELNLKIIENAILAHDLDVIDATEEIFKKWAMAILNLVVALNPNLVILGGVINDENEYIVRRIKHYISKVIYYDLDICARKKDSDAQIFGGIFMLKKYVINNILKERLLNE